MPLFTKIDKLIKKLSKRVKPTIQIHFHAHEKEWDWFVKTFNVVLDRKVGDGKRSETFFYADDVDIDGVSVHYFSPSFPNPNYDRRYGQCKSEYSHAIYDAPYFINYLFQGYLRGHVKITDLEAIKEMAKTRGIYFEVMKNEIDSISNIDCFLKCFEQRSG